MNERASQFGAFIKDCTILGKATAEYNGAFEAAFAVAIVSESRKRRMGEGCKNLAIDAARSMVEEYSEDFDKYRREQSPRFYYQWQKYDFEYLASEIVAHMTDNKLFKRIVESLLRGGRKELFEEAGFRQYISGFVVEEHPMQTFVFWLDYIDGLKGTAEYQSWIMLKRNLVNLTRIGTAVFSRSEWHTEIARA